MTVTNYVGNAIKVIYPYRTRNTWVFDDERVGLVREPFVAGADKMIDKLVKQAKIRRAKTGFTLLFSHIPFPGHQVILERQYEEGGGYWYDCKTLRATGWLCPALFKYFETAPEKLYVQAEGVD